MALIKCSECGKQISDKAQQCVGCGAPLKDLQNNDSVSNQIKDGNGSENKQNIQDTNKKEDISHLPREERIKKIIAEKKAEQNKKSGGGNYNTWNQNNASSPRPQSSQNINNHNPSNSINSNLIYIAIGAVLLIIWAISGFMNPVMLISSGSYKKQCLELANENIGKGLFDNREIKVKGGKIKDGNYVVSLEQSTNGDDLNVIFCVVDGDYITIPGAFNQSRWQ